MDSLTIQTYNQLAQEYDNETAEFWNSFPKTFIDRFVGDTKRLVAADQTPSVLNVGSGPGRDGLLLQSAGLDITCLDASTSMVELCCARGLKAIEGDLLNLPFEAGSFDAVWSYTALLHVERSEITQALREIKRVLKPGGTFALGLIEGDGEEYRTSSGVDRERLFVYYQKLDILNYLNDTDFTVEYFETFKPGKRNYLNFVSRAGK